MKVLKFVGSSLDDLRNFPDEVRRAAGFDLRTVQNGLDPSDWKPMQAIGRGVREIRIHVLHAFHKKSQKTNKSVIELARRRYKQIGGNL